MKKKAFFIFFKELSLKQIEQFFGRRERNFKAKCEEPTNCKLLGKFTSSLETYIDQNKLYCSKFETLFFLSDGIKIPALILE